MKPRAGKKAARDSAFAIGSSSVEETQRIGEALGRLLRQTVLQDRSAAVVALEGPLGSGKTAFVQGLARGVGAAGAVRSPTFTLIHEYPGAVPLYHVDLYRLGGQDVDGLGLEEYLDVPGVVTIEWPDRAAETLPPERLVIAFQFGEAPGCRRLSITPAGARYERLAAALKRCLSSP